MGYTTLDPQSSVSYVIKYCGLLHYYRSAGLLAAERYIILHISAGKKWKIGVKII